MDGGREGRGGEGGREGGRQGGREGGREGEREEGGGREARGDCYTYYNIIQWYHRI